MAHPRIMQPAGETPTGLHTTRLTARRMPDDLLREASERLGVISLLAGVLWFISPAFDHFVLFSKGVPGWAQFTMSDGVCVLAILASLALFLYSRRGEHDSRALLDLGLVYMIVQSFALGVIMHWDPIPVSMPIFPMISWLGVIVIMFAAIVPSTP